ncbi:OmpA family protein [Neisseria perflava]|uniref:OmpA family protein n=1 Tax=Neisseria perflava TaxID=33053 RepID=UPI00209C7194|nr:OmpA family protein [Neisseria perflava]MCP1660877.1 outer membrane protein OmpA-like peptidoglycan-associated protein [Neisseria perflava]MCP1773160.1 outer membrane protein OmpA-like peptidoglycan-associated protein [Neisseria perflava]
MTKLKIMSVAVVALALSACTTAGYPKEKWVDFRANTVTQQIAEGDSNLVFYRGETGNPKTAVNIYVNGEYHTSLQQDGYSQLEVCAQPQRIGAYVTGYDNQYQGKATGGETYDLPNGKSAYFRVVADDNGHAQLQPVSEEEATQEINHKKYQNNTLSRVDKVNTCVPREAKKYVLNAAALFPFNQSSAKSIYAKGRSEIAAVAQDIRNHPKAATSVEVIGHTDPQGKKAYNQTLSEKRAQAVGQLLVEGGVPANLVHTSGRGDNELLVTDCAKYKGAERKACDQPNRRVEIKLYTGRQQ